MFLVRLSSMGGKHSWRCQRPSTCCHVAADFTPAEFPLFCGELTAGEISRREKAVYDVVADLTPAEFPLCCGELTAGEISKRE